MVLLSFLHWLASCTGATRMPTLHTLGPSTRAAGRAPAELLFKRPQERAPAHRDEGEQIVAGKPRDLLHPTVGAYPLPGTDLPVAAVRQRRHEIEVFHYPFAALARRTTHDRLAG